jgi:hypothetical protein
MMHIFRCLYYCILSAKRAEKLLKIVTDRKKGKRTGGSTAASPAPNKKKAKVKSEPLEGEDL